MKIRQAILKLFCGIFDIGRSERAVMQEIFPKIKIKLFSFIQCRLKSFSITTQFKYMEVYS